MVLVLIPIFDSIFVFLYLILCLILCLNIKHKILYLIRFKYLVKICVNILVKDFEFSIRFPIFYSDLVSYILFRFGFLYLTLGYFQIKKSNTKLKRKITNTKLSTQNHQHKIINTKSNIEKCSETANYYTTVLPENIYPFTEVLPRPIRRLTPHSCLGKDAACQNFTEILPRFAAAYNITVNGKTQ